MTSRLKIAYDKEIVSKLLAKLSLKNRHEAPRIKDFRGLSSKGIDNSYNYSFGIKEHIVFPEVNFDKVDKIRGLDVTIVTSSKSKKGTLELLKEFNFPLNERKN